LIIERLAKSVCKPLAFRIGQTGEIFWQALYQAGEDSLATPLLSVVAPEKNCL
jgi:hypothetical protein